MITDIVLFTQELSQLLNKHCIDNELETPDFILADHIVEHIQSLREMNRRNIKWHEWKSIRPITSTLVP